jgi:isoquinoline 1-oxidoreductase subunit alpha
MTKLNVNGRIHDVGPISPDMPLLWVLRDHLHLVGTKYGCGVAQCGACTIHLDGLPVRSCVVRLGDAAGRALTTVEGLGDAGGELHPLQQSWIDLDVPQCGYCQSGQLMSAAALLARNRDPSAAEIDEALGGNICRCGTQLRIRQAVQRAAAQIAESNGGAA